MYKVNFTGRFKKDVKRCTKRGLDVSLIAEIVDMLSSNGSLPATYKPHKLIGTQGNNTWECHIQPDWLLIWQQFDDELILLMLSTGSHSDLF